MATLYTFDRFKTISDPRYPKTVADKVKTALTGAHIPKAHVDKFMAKMTSFNYSAVANTARLYVEKNMVAKQLAPTTTDTNALQKAFLAAIFGPQKAVLSAHFDLSVHLKNGNLEMHHTDCKGAQKVLYSIAP